MWVVIGIFRIILKLGECKSNYFIIEVFVIYFNFIVVESIVCEYWDGIFV